MLMDAWTATGDGYILVNLSGTAHFASMYLHSSEDLMYFLCVTCLYKGIS